MFKLFGKGLIFLVSGIIAAAGSGSRMGAGINKVFLELSGIPMLVHTLLAFEAAESIDDIIVAVGAEDTDKAIDAAKKYNITKFKKAIAGGASRQQSVLSALCVSDAELAVIHDGARALITPELIDRCVSDAVRYGAAAVGVKCVDSLKRTKNGFITETIERENVYNIQTPQIFNRKQLISLHKQAARDNIFVTDDTALAEKNGIKVFITEGSYENIKLTSPNDIITAEEILKRRKSRCG